MRRVSRDYVFHRIVADLSFSPLARQISRPQIFEIADRLAAMFCSETCMVVQARGSDGLNDTAGRFGRDEPWPEWVSSYDLVRERLMLPEDAPHCDGWTDSG